MFFLNKNSWPANLKIIKGRLGDRRSSCTDTARLTTSTGATGTGTAGAGTAGTAGTGTGIAAGEVATGAVACETSQNVKLKVEKKWNAETVLKQYWNM